MPKPHHKPGQVYQRHHSLNDVWDWLHGHGKRRWEMAKRWARKRKRHAPPSDHDKWKHVEHVYAEHLKKLREHHSQHGGQPQFEDWMLNGHPGNVSDAVKAAIARAVVAHPDTYVTATTDGVHAADSYHYRGEAADFGGPTTAWMGVFNDNHTRSLAGDGYYFELFGPPAGYLKYNVWYSGTSPDVPNHCHCAPQS